MFVWFSVPKKVVVNIVPGLETAVLTWPDVKEGKVDKCYLKLFQGDISLVQGEFYSKDKDFLLKDLLPGTKYTLYVQPTSNDKKGDVDQREFSTSESFIQLQLQFIYSCAIS